MRSKKAAINIITSLALQLVTILCTLIVPRLIITNFGSNVNGLINSITQFLAYITLLESGFGPVVKAILYKPIASKNKEEIEKILKASEKFFRIISYIFIIYIIALSFILPMILSKEFNELYTLSLIIIIAISTFSEYYFGMTYKLYLQAEQKTFVTSIIQIGTTILNTIMIIILIKLKGSIQIVKLISSMIFILRPILQNIYVKRKYNINLKNVKSDYKIKQKWEGLAQHIASVVHSNTDVVVLTIFTNTIEVSVYSLYLLIITGVKNVVQALTGGVDASFGDMIAKNEHDNLNRSFKTYESFYFTLSTIIFSATFLLIIPFIKIYTLGINDANYIRPLFSYLIVFAEFMWTIRLPYSSIILAAGHFKETRTGAWIEVGTNIILSIIFVFKYGINGVAIGTAVAMFIRTIEFMYHTSKYILKRNLWYTFKRLFVIAFEILVIFLIMSIIPNIKIIDYLTWVLYAIIVVLISGVIVISINGFIYKNEFKELIKIIKRLFLKKQRLQDIKK